MNIHPTAIVSPHARLADDVVVGPYSIIAENVEIAAGCVIQSHALIDSGTRVGPGTQIGHGAVIGAPPQDFAHRPDISSGVEIGSHNRIREYVTIHRGTKEGSTTRVGDHCFLMTGAHVGHNSEVGHHVILTNNVLLAGHVTVGEGAVLGGGSVFHQHIRVGTRAMVAGGSRFNKDIAPYVLAQAYNQICGINAVGLRRAGFSSEQRTELRTLYRKIFFSPLTLRDILAECRQSIWSPEAMVLIDFLETSKRGCCRPDFRGQVSEE
jgi:UDP-N-acetylglucosamine acyltransferase